MTDNTIHIDYRARPQGVREIMTFIDGVPLTEMVDAFETGGGMVPAGDEYGGLIPAYFRYGPMEDHFHGRTATAWGAKTPLLGCECGEVGCWPLLARISVFADVVIWDSFEQPFRKQRDYTAFGPFRFQREQYDEAVRDLSDGISAAAAASAAAQPPRCS